MKQAHLSPRESSQKGAIYSAMLAALIGLTAITAVFYASRSVRNLQIKRRELMLAETYAAELLEFFVSQSSDRLQNFLNTQPPLNTLRLCSTANRLDRATSTVVLPVDFAALPSGNLLTVSDYAPSRFFRLDVVDVRSRAVRTDLCGTLPRQVQLPGRTLAGTTVNLNPGETFQVTVWVQWKSRGTGSPLEVAVSASSQNL